jgi:AraC-like DNA-binding protein
MLTSLLFFCTSLLGLLCVANLLKNQEKYDHTYINKYLIIVFSIVTIRFFVLGLFKANPELHNISLIKILDSIFLISMPCYYLYFMDLMNQTKFNKKSLLHFLVPFLYISFVIISILFGFGNKMIVNAIFIVIVILYYVTYNILVIRLLSKNIWNRAVDINSVQKQNHLMIKWTKFLAFSFLLMFFLRIIPDFIAYRLGTENNFLWTTAPIWCIIFVFLLTTPEILYGFNYLNNTIDTEIEKVILQPVWNINGIKEEIGSEKDKKLEEKIKPSILEYIHQIERLSFHSHTFRNPDLSINDIAIALNVPSSHIYFVFKYHCNESFSDYKKIVRIHDATKLLKEGYLKNNKLETLSEFVGFSSYTTFFMAFKSITGVSMQEYVKRF